MANVKRALLLMCEMVHCANITQDEATARLHTARTGTLTLALHTSRRALQRVALYTTCPTVVMGRPVPS